MKAALLALSISLWAPYQCATEPNERPQEDSAPKALWMLAEKFEQEGNASARETTLHQLIEQYPSSRYAERARANMGMPSGRTGKFAGDEAADKDDKPKNPETGDE